MEWKRFKGRDSSSCCALWSVSLIREPPACSSSHLVHQQLNYSGVLEVVRIRREVRQKRRRWVVRLGGWRVDRVVAGFDGIAFCGEGIDLLPRKHRQRSTQILVSSNHFVWKTRLPEAISSQGLVRFAGRSQGRWLMYTGMSNSACYRDGTVA